MTIDAPTISAATALVAVVVSPLVSVYVAKRQIRASMHVAKQQIRASASVARRQIRASVISANRQAWINQLREALAELVTSLRFLNARRDGEIALKQDEWLERYQRALHLAHKVILLLNPNEADHKELSGAIKQASNLLLDGDADRAKKLLATTDRIVEQSQAILKREWERVKRGD